MNKRIVQLDSLRGLACFSVFLCHLPLDSLGLPEPLFRFLFGIGITNGYGSVMIFFALSGFVLSIPFMKHEKIDYPSYLVRRFFRIYIPYLIAIFVSIILSQIFFNAFLIGSVKWDVRINLSLIVQHIYLIGNIHSDAFNGVIWSLIHELRISLIFPFVVLLVKRINWKYSILICCALILIAGSNDVFHIQKANAHLSTYFNTFNYLSIFIFGALLAKHLDHIVGFYKKSSLIIRLLFLIVPLFIYNFSDAIVMKVYQFTGIKLVLDYFPTLVEIGMGVGGIGFLIIALSSEKIKKILMLRPISFLGKVSYSLYLYHLPVLILSYYFLNKLIPLWLVCLIAFVISIGISYLAWYFVEKTSVKIGRKVAQNLTLKTKKELTQVAS